MKSSKTMYMCVVCSISRPSLVPLTNELIQLLVTLVSPYISMTDFNISYLRLCSGCHIQIQSIHQFQRIALNGLNNLRQSLHSQTINGGYNHRNIEFVPLPPYGQWNPHPLSYNTIPRQSVPRNAEEPRAESFNVYTHRPMQVSGQCSMRTPPTPVPRESQDLTVQSVYVKDEPLIWDPNLDPKLITDCLATQPDVNSEEKESEFQPQIEGNSDVTCFESNIEPTIREGESREKTKPSKAAQVEKRPINDKPDKLVREPKERRTENISKEAVKDAEEVTAVRSARKRGFHRKPSPLVKCPHCEKLLRASGLSAHILGRHTDAEPAECDVCDKVFRNASILKQHKTRKGHYEQGDNDKSLRDTYCVECALQFSMPSLYKQHLSSLKHTPRDQCKFECEFCKKKFASKGGLQGHVEGMHLGIKKYTCVTCGQSFSNRTIRRTHMHREHGVPWPKKTLVCDLCGKIFKVKKSLEEHLLMHQGLRPYKCKLCPADFSYSAALYTHNQLKHLKKPRKKSKQKKGETKQRKETKQTKEETKQKKEETKQNKEETEQNKEETKQNNVETKQKKEETHRTED